MMEVKNLSAGYPGKPVLRNVNLQIPAGQVTVLAGPNGCGKSTLLKTLVGLISVEAGEILVAGKPMEDYSSGELARNVAYLPQKRPVPEITVERLVLHGRFPYLGYPRRYRGADYAAAEEAMNRLGLAEYRDTPVARLSGGMQQKAYIAMALVQDTPVILMDEPTAFLDIAHQLQLMEQAKALAGEGKTVVLVLHDLSMALGCADSMAVMSEGKCLFQGSPEDVFLSRCLDAAFGVEMQRFWTPNGWKYCWNGKHIP